MKRTKCSKAERVAKRRLEEEAARKLDLHADSTCIDTGSRWSMYDEKDVDENGIDKKFQVETYLPGMVILRKYLSSTCQQEIVDIIRNLGVGSGGFYQPVYASGAKCRLQMMCLGRHWNVVTEQYENTRTNFDHEQVPPLPRRLADLAQFAVSDAVKADEQVLGRCKSMQPDICIANFYKKIGRNGLHIDKDESTQSLDAGSPVVSFSIGCAAEFAYCTEYPEKGSGAMVPVVRLESGDVLLFGGPSRRLVHSLTRVYPNTSPEWLNMSPGRLNLTFREYCPTEII